MAERISRWSTKFPNEVVAHGAYHPNGDMDATARRIREAGFRRCGLELDWFYHIPRSQICISSRDSREKEPLLQVIQKAGSFDELRGFWDGDIIGRRSTNPIGDQILVHPRTEENHQLRDALGDSWGISIHSHFTGGFWDPRQRGPGRRIGVSNEMLRHLIVVGMWNLYDVVRAFAAYAETLQWEPTPDDEHRRTILEILTTSVRVNSKGNQIRFSADNVVSVDLDPVAPGEHLTEKVSLADEDYIVDREFQPYARILYKTPFDSHDALWDKIDCAIQDMMAFKTAGVWERVVPFGSLDNLERLRDIHERHCLEPRLPFK